MNMAETLRTGFRSLRSHKIRSVLTMLGIVIGVGSFVSMLALGEGAKLKIVRQIEALGTNVILAESSEPEGEAARRSPGLQYPDYLRLRSGLKSVQDVAPSIAIDATVVYKGTLLKTVAEGTSPSYSLIRNHPVEKGIFLSETDMEAWQRVAVIGKNLASKLFGDENPIGRDIMISGQRFVVVGIMAYKPQTQYIRFNDKIFIPATTALKFITGSERLDKILFRVRDKVPVDGAEKEIASRILKYHDGRKDFVITTQEQFLSTLTETSRTLKILLGTIASISLVVGGIGITNMMLVSVMERTREIGLRISLGATPDDIMRQFLLESIMLALIGGAVGTLLGMLFSKATGKLFTLILPGKEVWEAVVTPASIVGVLLFVTILGIVAGILPAYKASRLDPVEALRYE